ncbi:Diguanylate phosphodiesterase [Pseudodesulfovibrio profundus]|uniref:Diguanylate phosphodiesterase n=1 Tax=Pseudodesulfovibrio profundus TaxID=57320 RepID=A0A2C8F8F8_9BACT|nr:HDOD domain-containing protein [Pseudodesulfovibrio profundus]MBC17650.1 metal-dependent hydrolase [Desulfovibrio sp.]SOB59042.1 Diguanylate phosphodiesterase [Pseudodesulfovibrio profundus]|tara:strand:+ start:6384 stop:7640 length:1257 start_codon:yes stop_codon:yes gene_type:complete
MSEERAYESIFIARQPVFDERNKTWGYLLLFRDSDDADRAIFTDNSEATMNLVANLPLCGGIAGQKARQMIHFTPDDIRRGTHNAVPWSNTVLILEETAKVDHNLLDMLRNIQSDGYEIAVNNFEGKPGCEPLAEIADILIVDISGKEEADLQLITAKAQKFGSPQLIAKRVENAEELKKAQDTGFHLFHGFFFKHPATESGRKIPSSKATRLKLFEIIEKDEPDFDALTSAIEADVAISYRLLNFLNSANFSFATTITSIRQAVVLAGWKPIRNWLRLIILTDITPSEKSQELAYISAHRAKLFETAALGGGYEEESDRLFMLGLFSLLDAMLDSDMSSIVEHLPVDDKVKDALCGKQNQFAIWLDLTRAIEHSDWDEVGKKAKELNLLPGTVAVSYQHAFTWADAFFSPDPKEPIQ